MCGWVGLYGRPRSFLNEIVDLSFTNNIRYKRYKRYNRNKCNNCDKLCKPSLIVVNHQIHKFIRILIVASNKTCTVSSFPPNC